MNTRATNEATYTAAEPPSRDILIQAADIVAAHAGRLPVKARLALTEAIVQALEERQANLAGPAVRHQPDDRRTRRPRRALAASGGSHKCR